MIQPVAYHDLHGAAIPFAGFDDEERAVLDRLRRRAAKDPPWRTFENEWTVAVSALYAARGLSRRAIVATPLWKIGQDLAARLGIDQGLMGPPDYRDEMEQVIRERFPTRRAFCEATGISEDMLSHVLARRKHLAIDTLSEALARIGYALRIVPVDPPTKTSTKTKSSPPAKKAPPAKKGRAARK